MAMNQDENILFKISEQCDQKDYESAKILLVPYLKQNPNHGEANFLMVRVLTQDYTLEKVDEDFEQYFQVALIHAKEKKKSYNNINSCSVNLTFDTRRSMRIFVFNYRCF